MKVVHKYPFDVLDLIKIKMPEGARVLTVQTQRGVPCIWAIVDTEQPTKTHYFRVFGTGHADISDQLYIGTFQLFDGEFIGHLFEEINNDR